MHKPVPSIQKDAQNRTHLTNFKVAVHVQWGFSLSRDLFTAWWSISNGNTVIGSS